MPDAIKLRRGAASLWTSRNPVLRAGEPGLETDTGKIKYGDGVTAWVSLAYAPAGAIPDGSITAADLADGAVTMAKINQASATSGQVITWNGSAWAPATPSGVVGDGDKGDITVSGGGTTWTVDGNTIAASKMSASAGSVLFGRASATPGAGDQIAVGSEFSLSGNTLSLTYPAESVPRSALDSSTAASLALADNLTLAGAGLMGKDSAGAATRVEVGSEFSLSGNTLSLTYPDESIPASALALGGGFIRRVEATGNAATNRANITAALQAVAAHGGTVELGYGNWPLTTVQGTTPGASAGAKCLEIPSNVRLKGQGRGETNLLFTAGGAFGTGACITPEGMDTASVDYGAASNWALSDMTISATDQAASSGNLISLYHASDFLLENLDLGACYYHCLEVGPSRRGLIRRVQFSGDHQGGSGNYIQFDNGDGGHRSTEPTTNVIDDITFEDVAMLQRPNTGAVRDIEGFHSTSQTLQNIRFCRLTATGQARASSFIFDTNFAVTNGGIRGLYFDECEFISGHYDNMAIRIAPPGTGGYHEGVFIRDCVFRGPSCRSVWAYGNTTPTVNITNNDRREYHILRNRFYFDATQMPASAYDYFPLVVNQITGAVVQGNRFEKTGNFPGGWSHMNSSSVIRIGNCRDASVLYNAISWTGNNASTSRTAIYWSNEASDLTGMTRRTICRGNTLYSENNNWSYGILMQTKLASSPQCVHAFTDNTATGATSGGNNVLETTT